MIWLFAYGSLIWRPGFDYAARQQAMLHGYERRFCQASHDHRGSAEQPGRVVTLLPVTTGSCTGIAFGLGLDCAAAILEALDEREQDGYVRVYVDVMLEDGTKIQALTWIAEAGNPSWRGGEPIEAVAEVIAESQGQSGSNKDYLYQLHTALLELNIEDAHVSKLSGAVRSIDSARS